MYLINVAKISVYNYCSHILFNSITKYITEYFNFTQLHYQLNQWVKNPITCQLSITLPIT